MHLARYIRLAAYRWHCLVAESEAATRAYVGTLSAIARNVPNLRIRKLMEWAITGQRVPWQPLAFAPRRITVGRKVAIKLTPHLGECDQTALFNRRLGYDAPIFSWLERNATERYEAVVEIGANVGMYTVFFDALIRGHPEGRLRRVYAFEPSRTAYCRLLANLEANQARTVESFAVGVSGETGFAQFYEPKGRLTNGSLSRGFAELFSRPIYETQIITIAGSELGELFAHHQRVLLKVDAEGAEPAILESMRAVIERHRPDLLIEVLNGVDAKLAELECLRDYELFRLTSDGPLKCDRLQADPSSRDWLLTKSSARD